MLVVDMLLFSFKKKSLLLLLISQMTCNDSKYKKKHTFLFIKIPNYAFSTKSGHIDDEESENRT